MSDLCKYPSKNLLPKCRYYRLRFLSAYRNRWRKLVWLRVVFPCRFDLSRYSTLRKFRRCKKQYKFWFECHPYRKIEKWVDSVLGLCKYPSKNLLPMSRYYRLHFLSVCRSR